MNISNIQPYDPTSGSLAYTPQKTFDDGPASLNDIFKEADRIRLEQSVNPLQGSNVNLLV